MLHYVRMNLFDSPAQTLVNAVNTVGVMGKGVAKDFKLRYPEMYKRYREHCKAGRFQTGMLWLYKTPNKWVLNFPTKRHWRSASKLQWIEQGLSKFALTYSDRGVESISFPMLGCGNGGLDWQDVQPLMEHYLGKLAIPVYVHVAGHSSEFIPEHLDKKQIEQLQREALEPRRNASFHEFLVDMGRLGMVVLPETLELPKDEDSPSISLELGERGATVSLLALESLWRTLSTNGGRRAKGPTRGDCGDSRRAQLASTP